MNMYAILSGAFFKVASWFTPLTSSEVVCRRRWLFNMDCFSKVSTKVWSLACSERTISLSRSYLSIFCCFQNQCCWGPSCFRCTLHILFEWAVSVSLTSCLSLYSSLVGLQEIVTNRIDCFVESSIILISSIFGELWGSINKFSSFQK